MQVYSHALVVKLACVLKNRHVMTCFDRTSNRIYDEDKKEQAEFQRTPVEGFGLSK